MMLSLHRLPNQQPGEKTLLVLRRHWIVPGKLILTLCLGALLPLAIFFLVQKEKPDWLIHPVMTPTLILTASFYFLAIWMFVFQEIIDYYLDLWIVTTHRIINIEQRGLFARTSSELHLSNVVDATSEIKGVLHTLLNIGDVIVQTAGELPRFHFKEIHRPEDVRQSILKIIDEDRRRRASSSS